MNIRPGVTTDGERSRIENTDGVVSHQTHEVDDHGDGERWALCWVRVGGDGPCLGVDTSVWVTQHTKNGHGTWERSQIMRNTIEGGE
jgi:hypothetical protein